MKGASQRREQAKCSRAVTMASSSILFGAVFLLSHFTLPPTVPIRLVLLVSGSDLFGLNIIMISAGLVPGPLGSDYSETVCALRWLAFLPVLKTVHYSIADSLSGAGYQAIRACIQTSVAVFNVLVNLWRVPKYSWRGETWWTLASDGLLAASLWVMAIELRRHERNEMQELTEGLR